jgi:hypothetical protein
MSGLELLVSGLIVRGLIKGAADLVQPALGRLDKGFDAGVRLRLKLARGDAADGVWA